MGRRLPARRKHQRFRAVGGWHTSLPGLLLGFDSNAAARIDLVKNAGELAHRRVVGEAVELVVLESIGESLIH
jgi:hypothetical protein